MGILDALSGGLTAATNAATAQQQGQLQGNQLAAALMMRQMQMAKDQADMKQALARANLFTRQANQPMPGDPDYLDFESQLAQKKASGTAQGEDSFKRGIIEFQNKLESEREAANERLKAGLTPHYTPFQGTDANGQPIAVPFNTKQGTFGQPAQNVFPAGKGTLPPNIMAGMREQAAQADQIMRDFEAKYGSGQAGVGVGSSVLGGMANQHPNGIMSAAGRALGNMGLAATNPEYQRYIAAQQRFGNIMGNVMSKRYSEYQGALDTDLSGLKSGDLQPTIQLKQSYRQDLLNHMPQGLQGSNTTGNAPAGGTSTSAPDRTSQIDAMIKAGKSDAEIRAALGTP